MSAEMPLPHQSEMDCGLAIIATGGIMIFAIVLIVLFMLGWGLI
jgi:hypothetical protein